jgi:uncharacterized protein
VSAAAKTRRSSAEPVPRTRKDEEPAPATSPPRRAREAPPFLLDFFPLEGPEHTRLSRFYDRLRSGRLSTTQCPNDGELHWPPRTACPKCHGEELAWVDLPERGRIYAFSAVLGGAPLGMESEVPFAVGLVDLDGVPLRLFGRIEGRPWSELKVGGLVRVEPYELGDGRVFYRFRAAD